MPPQFLSEFFIPNASQARTGSQVDNIYNMYERLKCSYVSLAYDSFHTSIFYKFLAEIRTLADTSKFLPLIKFYNQIYQTVKDINKTHLISYFEFKDRVLPHLSGAMDVAKMAYLEEAKCPKLRHQKLFDHDQSKLIDGLITKIFETYRATKAHFSTEEFYRLIGLIAALKELVPSEQLNVFYAQITNAISQVNKNHFFKSFRLEAKVLPQLDQLKETLVKVLKDKNDLTREQQHIPIRRYR